MEMKLCEKREPSEKKSIAFKVTPTILEDKESINEGEEE